MNRTRRTGAIATIAAFATFAGGLALGGPAMADDAAFMNGPGAVSAPTPAPSAPGAHNRLPRLKQLGAAALSAQAAKLPDALRQAIRSQLGISPSEFLAEGAASSQASTLIASARARGIEVRDARLDGTKLIVTVGTKADAVALAGTGAAIRIGTAVTRELPASITPIRSEADPSLTTGLHGGQGWWAPTASDSDASAYACSVGFNGYDTARDILAFVTAGHCELTHPLQAVAYSTGSTSIDTIQSANATQIGTPDSDSFLYGDGYDSGLIDPAPTFAAPADVTTWGGSAGVGGSGSSDSTQNVQLAGATSVLAGSTVCRSGYRSGWWCGYVLGGVTVSICSDGSASCADPNAVDTLVTSACSQEGDSGGPFLAGQFAVGTLTGSNWPQSDNEITQPVCTATAASANNSRAQVFLNTPSNSTFQAVKQSVAYPMVPYTWQDGAGGTYTTKSIETQNPSWQLAVWFATPTVSTATTDRIGGTIALNTTPGAVNPDAVQLALDGGAPTTVAVTPDAADPAVGTWSLPLALAGAGHHFTVNAASTQSGSNYSRSSASGGTLTAVAHPSLKVAGTARVRATLTASSVGWPSGTHFSYRWYASGKAIAGGTHRTLTVKSAQYKKRITVKVTGSLAGWQTATATSAPTKSIAAGTMRAGRPAITGRAVVGGTLREHPGTWSPSTVKRTLRWYANGKPIAGGTRSTLRLTKSMRGKRITVKLVGRLGGYVTTSEVSAKRIVVR